MNSYIDSQEVSYFAEFKVSMSNGFFCFSYGGGRVLLNLEYMSFKTSTIISRSPPIINYLMSESKLIVI